MPMSRPGSQLPCGSVVALSLAAATVVAAASSFGVLDDVALVGVAAVPAGFSGVTGGAEGIGFAGFTTGLGAAVCGIDTSLLEIDKALLKRNLIR